MKRKLITIFLSIAMILGVVGVVAMPQEAQAACSSLLSFNFGECVTEGAAWLGSLVMGATSYLVTAAGALLSVSIKLTLNIKDIYEKTPAIDATWKVVRDLSSIFIIFILLYASISTIIGIGKTGIKEVIGKVIIVGLLINFSLFFTKVAIDTSNLVSIQFYRAIAPESTNGDVSAWSSSFYDGGISNILMNSLKLPTLYHPSNASFLKNASDEGSILSSIILGTVGGSILMIFAALSFLAAAVAFAIRTAILLLLMVFSPLYFVGEILPSVRDKVSKKWEDMLISQLTFMPVYLLLMYVALRVIGDEGFMSFLKNKNPSEGFVFSQIGIIIQYFIAIIFINAPLIAALDVGGKSMKWGDAVRGWAGDKLKGGAGFFGQQTAGRAAKALKEAPFMSKVTASNPNLAILANKTLSGVSGATFGGSKGGYDKRFKEYSKARADLVKNVKASESDKEAIKPQLAMEITKWENNVKELQKEVADKEKEYNKYVSQGLEDREGGKKAKAALDEAEKKLKESGNREDMEKGLKKKLEGEVDKLAKIKFAKTLEEKAFFGTGKASKEAADAIRKDLEKTDDKRIQEMIKKALESGDEK